MPKSPTSTNNVNVALIFLNSVAIRLPEDVHSSKHYIDANRVLITH